jgi:hypothetical protein
MIKTLKFSNGSNAAIGNLQIQPIVNSSVSVTNASNATTANASLGNTAIGFVKSNGDMNIAIGKTLTQIVNALTTNRQFVIPPYQTTNNSILATVPKSDARVVTGKLLPRVVITKFDSYEQLTGISQNRPEIISLTCFKPLFNRVDDKVNAMNSLLKENGTHVDMTAAGKFLETYYQTRQLICSDIVQLLRILSKEFEDIKNELETRYSNFEACVKRINSLSEFLFSLINLLNQAKFNLNLRHDLHTVKTRDVVNEHYTNYSTLASYLNSDDLYNNIAKYTPTKYTYVDLLERLGYKRENIKKFASTKLWLQTLVELKDSLTYHSPELLGLDRSAQNRDNSAITTTRLVTKHFRINNDATNLPSIKEIVSFDYARRYDAVKWLKQTWSTLYKDSYFSVAEVQIAALANLLTKEFRYSVGLASPEVKKILKDSYLYDIAPSNNVNVFDSIIGEIGSSISEFPRKYTSSLASLAQQLVVASSTFSGVLTFESKYIEADKGVLTPGSVYFIDSILDSSEGKIDTKKLAALSLQFDTANKNINKIANSMNLFGNYLPNAIGGAALPQCTMNISNSSEFVKYIVNNLIDVKTGKLIKEIDNDDLTALYAYVASDSTLKAVLFYYTLTKVTRSYYEISSQIKDNTILSNQLLKDTFSQLIASIQQTLPESQYKTFQTLDTPYITADALYNALNGSSSKIVKIVESIMTFVLTSFKSNNTFDTDSSKTRYSGCIDTNVMMITFDLLTNIIAKFCNKQIVSYSTGTTSLISGHTTFHLVKTTNSRTSVYNDIITRLEKETSLTTQCFLALFNSMSKLSSATGLYVSILDGSMTKQMQEISNVINNKTLLKMLLDEQQIMSLTANAAQFDQQYKESTADTDKNNPDTLELKNFKILDESNISSKLKDALYTFLNSNEFASEKGYNKKIITVGIPLGFTHNLKQMVSLSSIKEGKVSFEDKQSDIIKVCIYKSDLQNSDLVYKPLTFLFELSRFVDRQASNYINVNPESSLMSLLQTIPTRDYNTDPNNRPWLSYWARGAKTLNGFEVAMADDSYSFLNDDEKEQIIKNHIFSYLLEVYIKLMTGINLSERSFQFQEIERPHDIDIIGKLVNTYVSYVTDKLQVKQEANQQTATEGGVLFSSTNNNAAGDSTLTNSAGTQGSSATNQFAAIKNNVEITVASLEKGLSQVTDKELTTIIHGLKTISNLANIVTTLADTNTVTKINLMPSQFDRVFNVIIDPDDFELDYEKTVKNPQGKQILEQYLKNGDILTLGTQESSNTLTSMNDQFVFRDRTHTEGDLVFEKYFVTIETYGEDQV